MQLHDIARLIGVVYEGDSVEIIGLHTLKEANETQLSFVVDAAYVRDLASTKAAAVIVPSALASQVPQGCIALVSEEVYLKMAIISKAFALPLLDKSAPAPVIGEGSFVSPAAAVENGAVIGKNCTIMAGAYVGLHVRIGDNVTLYPNVSVYPYCVIGNGCIVHSGTVIGSDGFGYAHTKTGEHVKIYQNGNAVLEEEVEIGANCCIDRAVFGSTVIKRGTKIDNLVQIAHNCVIGEHSIIVSQSGIAGSTTLGRNVVMGGQSATAGHLTIAAFTTFAARSGVTKDVKESGKTFGGFPLMEQRQWLKLQGKIAKLLS
ncbi:MAG: UDP-3-O-(3-hydroxymyristoyl)glucosamine N-acyltransferase [Campylobacterales bacterium]|nr:UDP-3-O-(3-hydroxymyristoyl)glucosamine N-acyltransferase [Campylobacterales bacterium]